VSVVRRDRACGFTLLELVIALAVLSVLITMAAPVLRLQLQRQKEAELRTALRDIRSALDDYKRASEDGRIKLAADASGYPASLDILVDGVNDARFPQGKLVYFLRRLPRDPMAPDASVPASQTWGTRSYASPPGAPASGVDVFDVYSLSDKKGINGLSYKDW